MSEKILIVDDEDANLRLLTQWLIPLGYDVELASNGKEAVQKAGECRPDLIILDIMMPVMDGYEACGSIKADPETKNIPIIMVTALHDRESKLKGLSVFANDFVSKPIDQTELTIRVANLLKIKAFEDFMLRHNQILESDLRMVIEKNVDGLIIVDVDGKVRFMNPAAESLFGDSAEKLMGKIIGLPLISGEANEVDVCPKNGTPRTAEMRTASINWEQKAAFLISLRDITERKYAEDHLRESRQELQDKHIELEKTYSELKSAQLQIFQQEKMASIGQMAAGVAHEINNPMGFISSNLSTLYKYIDRLTEFITVAEQSLIECAGSGGSDKLNEVRKRLKIDYIVDDARQLIAESQDGASRVRRIVQDLKSFSRVDQVEQAMINLNESLKTSINIAWNEIKYVAEVNQEFGDIPDILCFPQQLNQVFLNLLINAAHAMEERQGIITVRTWSAEDAVFVSIADTGSGMPDEIRQRIFEPFFTTKEVGKGTGLGLSISYDIIRKHGGDIKVASELNVGSTFTVRLPLNQR